MRVSVLWCSGEFHSNAPVQLPWAEHLFGCRAGWSSACSNVKSVRPATTSFHLSVSGAIYLLFAFKQVKETRIVFIRLGNDCCSSTTTVRLSKALPLCWRVTIDGNERPRLDLPRKRSSTLSSRNQNSLTRWHRCSRRPEKQSASGMFWQICATRSPCSTGEGAVFRPAHPPSAVSSSQETSRSGSRSERRAARAL